MPREKADVANKPLQGAKPCSSSSRERACAGCKIVSPAESLLRFALSPTKEFTLDLRAQLPGRGAWVCPTLPCLEKGVLKRGFARCLHAPVRADPITLSQTTQDALKRYILQGLGLCYRSSQCSFGKDRCLRFLAQGDVSALIFACDLSERSVQEVLQQEPFQESTDLESVRQKSLKNRTLFETNERFEKVFNKAETRTEVIKTHFSKRELGQALGRQEVGIVSLLQGKLACRLLERLRCLYRLQTSLQHKQLYPENP